VLFRSKLVIW